MSVMKNHFRTTFLFLCLSLLAIGYWNCNQTSVKNPVNTTVNALYEMVDFKSPFADIRIPFQQFAIDVSSGGKIELDNGTTLTIPKDAFVDMNGNPINGNVNLQYREFQSATDILVSGIPMTFKNNGKTEYFESAGMFQLEANFNGSPIKLKDDKSIDVSLASYKEGEDFNFYRMDENSKSWNQVSPPVRPVRNPNFNTSNNSFQNSWQLPPTPPIKPIKADPNGFVFDLEANLDQVPGLKTYFGVMWQYCGDENDIQSNPEKNEWIFEQNWKLSTVKNVNSKTNEEQYLLVLSNEDLHDFSNNRVLDSLKKIKKYFSCLVKPVLSGKHYTNALKKYQEQMQNYKVQLEEYKDIEKANKKVAPLLRNFAINEMGMYNWDRFYKGDDRIFVNAKFDFPEKIEGKNVELFMICGKDVVIRFDPNYGNDFSYSPNEKTKLIAVMPDQKIAYLGSKDFEKLDHDKLKQQKEHTFKLKLSDKKLSNYTNLDNFLKTL